MGFGKELGRNLDVSLRSSFSIFSFAFSKYSVKFPRWEIISSIIFVGSSTMRRRSDISPIRPFKSSDKTCALTSAIRIIGTRAIQAIFEFFPDHVINARAISLGNPRNGARRRQSSFLDNRLRHGKFSCQRLKKNSSARAGYDETQDTDLMIVNDFQSMPLASFEDRKVARRRPIVETHRAFGIREIAAPWPAIPAQIDG